MISKDHRTSFQTRVVAENALVISVVGDLDIESSPAFREEVERAVQGDRRVILSLEQCHYCDSSALVVLIRACKTLGSRLLVIVPKESHLNRLFEITGLSEEIPMKPTLDGALVAVAI